MENPKLKPFVPSLYYEKAFSILKGAAEMERAQLRYNLRKHANIQLYLTYALEHVPSFEKALDLTVTCANPTQRLLHT